MTTVMAQEWEWVDMVLAAAGWDIEVQSQDLEIGTVRAAQI